MVVVACKMKVRLRQLAIMTALGVVCFAGTAGAGLAERIDGIIRQPSQSKVQYSVHIVKADTGRALYSHNAAEALMPASNMKIIVTAAALKYLGPDYVFATKVGLCGDRLVIIGSGDPLLGDNVTDAKYGRAAGWIFADIADKLKEKGITSIKDMVIDTTIFDDVRVHPSWPEDQLNKWFACEVAGLNYNDNCIEMTAKTVGGQVVVTIEPETDFIQITNEVVAVQQGGGVGAYRQLGKPNCLIVKGKCMRQEGPFEVAIERPAAFFGYLLAERLLAAGVSTQGQLIEKAMSEDCDFEELAEYTTSMADCLKRCNKNSLGLAAEALMKTIAANSQGGRNGSWERGRRIISEYLREVGVDESEFYIDDASGLSRQNELSARAITKVLYSVYKSGQWGLYKDSLAIAGVDGTIKRYFGEEKYKGKIFGKTGYISGVKSFSGMCTTGEGDYLFSILANKANGLTRKAINDIAKAIIDDKAGDAGGA
ncbi:MAG TPA: D-alanyl-D-alanine carboxypeptidase/D-alanyl-D-alanine-endopeptidase [Sedimentisphaerales bacterium]|nr:D-alanyl-D-alanine carboxypeptidase/D-alanyl-D-alanine-endopeptidase [Sedimentisphaerales bacterium]